MDLAHGPGPLGARDVGLPASQYPAGTLLGGDQAAVVWRASGCGSGGIKAKKSVFARLRAGPDAAGEVIRRETNYFAGLTGRVNYPSSQRRGLPIRSGPVESACRQK
jgi:hypothetical protein